MDDFWAWAKVILQCVTLPTIGMIGYMIKKHIARIEDVEKDVRAHSIRLSIVETVVQETKDDIKEIKNDVKELLSRKD